LVSRATASELTRVLAYPKFRLAADEQLEALGAYLPFCETVHVSEECIVLWRDRKDQPLLDLAQSGTAELLVTGDEDLLVLAGQTTFLIEPPEAYRHRVAGTDTHP
jgi:putative PIN family toxin of toxin-antitoxin system